MRVSVRTFLLVGAFCVLGLIPGARPITAQVLGQRPVTGVPVGPIVPGAPLIPQGLQFAQFPGGGFGGGGFGGGQFGGGRFGGGQFGGGQFGGGQFGGGFPGGGGGIGRQGGGGFGGGSGVVDAGGSFLISASCTDLFLPAPDATTRYTASPDAGQVELADGSTGTLQAALDQGILILRGGDRRTDPSRRNPFLLDLMLVNPGPAPVRVTVKSGAVYTPRGQAPGTIPPGFDKLVTQPAARQQYGRAPLACAVWAARGSTREDVEQTLMVSLPAKDVATTQHLLDGAGIQQQFDRDAGSYERLYKEQAEKLHADDTLRGSTPFSLGTMATVEGQRNDDGQGVVALHPKNSAQVYRYAAAFKDAGRRKVIATLIHLKSGGPVEAHGGQIVIQLPAAG